MSINIWTDPMQSVPREWLDFLRQQFPKDSRIQLTEIGGNPRPISPGSTGKLDYIDDAGQFHEESYSGQTSCANFEQKQ